MSIDSLQTRFLDNERLKIGTEYPSWYSTLSDKGLYRRLASQGKVPKELKIEEYETGYSSLGKQSKYSQEETDSAQNQMGFLQSSADYIISENSPDWAKAAYNRSLTGMTEQMFTGKQRYNVDELDFNIGEDIAASFFSFFMPLDIAEERSLIASKTSDLEFIYRFKEKRGSFPPFPLGTNSLQYFEIV